MKENKKDKQNDRMSLEKFLNDVIKQANDGNSFLSAKRTEIAQNDRLYNGNHWYGVSSGNKAEKPQINVTRRISDFKISSIMMETIGANYKVKGVKENSSQAELYAKGADIFTKLAKSTDKRVDSQAIDERMLKRANVAGKGLVHYFWDDSIEDGNDIKSQGDFVPEVVHSINWYPSDVNNPRIQGQDYHILATRRTFEWVKKFAKANGRTEEEIKLISPDEDLTQAGFDSAQRELDNSENLWVYAKYWHQGGKIWGGVVCKGLVLKHPFDTELDEYPLVGMDWLEKEEDAYGLSEITGIKPNQFAINKMLANACVSITKTAHPIMIYNKQLMGLPSGQPGTAFGVTGSVNDAFKFESPGQMAFDIWRMLDSLIAWTKEMAGATETALGEVKPENTSALLANQAQAAVPIASILRRFKQYKIDTYRVYCDFYRNKYDMTRLVDYQDKEGNDVSEAFTGTDYKDIKFGVELDVGPTSQFNEVIATNMLNNLLQQDKINFIQFLERIGDTIPKKQELIDDLKGDKDSRLFEFMKTLNPEELQGFLQMPQQQRDAILSQGA